MPNTPNISNISDFTKALFLNDMYQGILDIPGSILHIGCEPDSWEPHVWSWLGNTFESHSKNRMVHVIPRDTEEESITLKGRLQQIMDTYPYITISLAYFDGCDFHITRDCLNGILPRLTRGSILAFSDIQHSQQSIAILDVFGFNDLRLQQWHASRTDSYVIL